MKTYQKTQFVTVAQSDSFIVFLHWLKEKNETLLFDAYPPDEQMAYKIQETFGFKYRKFHKDTL